jgi:signal transduction histidine kinase
MKTRFPTDSTRLIPRWNVVEARFFKYPAYLSVVVRWITWLVAAVAVSQRAAPPENLIHSHLLLALTGLWCVLISLFGPILRPRLGSQTLSWIPRASAVFDLLFSAFVIYASGGFRSPFYEFSLTSVIAPSLQFGLLASLACAAAYCMLYFAAVALSGPGLAAVMREGVMDGTLFSSLLNPFTVAVFCGLLGLVVQRLNEERRASAELAALEERTRLAREIHDGVAQRIFMLTLSLETCAELSLRDGNAGADREKLQQRLTDLMKTSKQALWEVRHYIFDLKPLLEGQSDLSGTVRGQIKEFEAISGIDVAFGVEGDEVPVPLAVRTAVFRIVQEGLANAYKHAQCSHIDVTLQFMANENVVKLSLHDDGKGFDASAPRERGVGLSGMTERARGAGGELVMHSALGEGTRLTAVWPLRPQTRRAVYSE